MSLAGVAPRPPLKCFHCGREVLGTVHTRTSYRVDYYALHTGDVEPVTLQRADDAMTLVTVLKLVHPTEVITCVDCYRQPTIQRRREQLFRPELQPVPEENAAS